MTVGDFVRSRKFASRLEAVRATIERFGTDRDRHTLFYSLDIINNTKARREWIPPDREPSPELCGYGYVKCDAFSGVNNSEQLATTVHAI